MRLTPDHATERHERLLTVAAYLHLAGETQRLTDLLGPAIGGLPSGTARARARLLPSTNTQHLGRGRPYLGRGAPASGISKSQPTIHAR